MLQYTLQLAPGVHLRDRNYCGYFPHSCTLNISLDMETLTDTAIRDIEPGNYLFMDYAETGEVLYEQFQCRCDSPQCRAWITGRKENIDSKEKAFS